MTNKCLVCGQRGKPRDGLSFHRFPDNVERKNNWLKAVNIENAGKWQYVCSDHFKNTDYVIKKSGLKMLKKTAIPFLHPASPVPSVSHIGFREIGAKNDCEELFAVPSTSKDQRPSTSRDSNCSMVIPAATSTSYSTSPTLTASERTLTASDITATSEETLSGSDSGTLTASEGSKTAADMSLINIEDDQVEIPIGHFSSSVSNSTRSEGSINVVRKTEEPPKKRGHYSSSVSTLTGSEGSMNVVSNTKEPPKKRRKLRRKAYIGDISSGDLATPTKAKKSFNLVKTKIATYRKKIDLLQRQNRRMKAKVNNLKSLLTFLKQKNLISESAHDSIEASLPGSAAELVKRIVKGSKSEPYSPTLRAFALTLHFYSPRAYNFVREKFNKSLPHPSTVSKWYQKIDGSPGFTEESLRAIEDKVRQNREKGKQTYANLVMDEMSIRKKVEWVGEKLVGFVDIGTNIMETDSLPEAKEVLVFLITSVNGNWKIPVGYFCLDGLSGAERANLVKECLEFLHKSGVIITSLTFDGAAANITMAKKLGANFDDCQNLKTYFIHPVTKEKVFIFLDVCHMIKLIRNCLGDLKHLRTEDDKHVSWNYLDELVNIQIKEGLHAGSKIKRRHIQYAKEKMRVKIATQTFSRSVSDALLFLEEDLKLDSFRGAQETANFCLIFNDVFDILNSRNKFSSYIYKSALSRQTENLFLSRFNDLRKYISKLSINNVPVTSGPRKTGFLGFLIAMDSFECLYKKYVKEDAKLDFLLGYKFSQDHLETFFSSVRSMHGFNNNPTCRQFQSAYKKLLISREVRGADTANAVSIDNTLILNVSSRKITLNDDQEDLEKSEEYRELCRDHDSHEFFSSSGWQLSSFLNDVIIYIAGFVVKSLKKCITCSKCLALLETNETSSFLQKRKTYGNLVKASSFVSEICTWGERIFRQMQEKIFSAKYKVNIIDVIINKTVAVLPQKCFDYFGDHIFDGELLDNHQLSLIKLILKRYFTIRMHHETRKKSDEVKNRVRSILTHLILYQNQ